MLSQQAISRINFLLTIVFILPSLQAGMTICSIPKDVVCLEAEQPVKTNFIWGVIKDRPATRYMTGSGYLNLNKNTPPNNNVKTWYSEWIFRIPKNGEYNIWVLDSTLIGRGKWCLGNKHKWNYSPNTAVTVDSKLPGANRVGVTAWHRINTSPFKLSTVDNPYRLKFEVIPEAGNNRVYYCIDAIAIVPVAQKPSSDWICVKADKIDSANPELTIPRMDKLPKITGEPGKSILHGLAKILLVDTVSTAAPKKSTTVWMGYRPEGIYLYFKCDEPSMKDIKAMLHANDVNLWEDDNVEIFVGPEASKEYAHWIINSLGFIYDYCPPKGLKWQSEADVVTRKNKDFWTVEAFIPAKCMKIESGKLKAGMQFACNVNRTAYNNKGGSEMTSWSATGGSNHNRKCFGKITLGGRKGKITCDVVKGRVVDEDGKCLSGARVASGDRVTYTDAKGYFIISGPRFKGSGKVTAWQSRYNGATATLSSGKNILMLEKRQLYGYPKELAFKPHESFRVVAVGLCDIVNDEYYPQKWDEKPVASVFAAKGQVQPFSFAVYTKKDIGNVEFEVSAFSDSAGNKLPPADVRLVTMRPRRMNYSSNRPGDPRPEMLESYENSIQIPAKTFRQIWISVCPPENAKAGIYKAILKVKTQKTGIEEVPLNVNVLPFVLKKPANKHLGVHWYGREGNHWVFNPGVKMKDYPAQWRDMAEHGISAITFSDTPEFIVRGKNGKLCSYSGFSRVEVATREQQLKYSTLKTGEVAIDVDSLMNVMEGIHKYGLDSLVLQVLSVKTCVARVTGVPLAEVGWHGRVQVNEEFKSLLKRTIETIDDAVKDKGYMQIHYVMDDEVYWGGEYRMSGYLRLANMVLQAGGLNAITMSYGQLKEEIDQLRKVVDIPIGHLKYEDILKQNYGCWKNKLAVYTQIWTGSFHQMRTQCGIVFWEFPNKYFILHPYMGFVGDAFDDMDGTVPDMCAVYPTKSGKLIPTLQWEGLRQGFYDMCYVNTLIERIKELKDGQQKTKCEFVLKQINHIVHSYASSDGNLDGLTQISPEELDKIRTLAAKAIAESF